MGFKIWYINLTQWLNKSIQLAEERERDMIKVTNKKRWTSDKPES